MSETEREGDPTTKERKERDPCHVLAKGKTKHVKSARLEGERGSLREVEEKSATSQKTRGAREVVP